MKLRDLSRTSTVLDLWQRSIAAEFGSRGHVATAARLGATISTLLDQPGLAPALLVDFGHQIGADGLDLDFALRALQLLAVEARRRSGVELGTRIAAVAVANGWSTGVVNRARLVHSTITPRPIFMQLLRQRFDTGGEMVLCPAARAVLVVAEIDSSMTDALELSRVQMGVVQHLRSVFGSGQPIAAGTNGTVIVLVEREQFVAGDVLRIAKHFASSSLDASPVRVWIEPLPLSRIHLDAHIEGLIGELM